MTELVVTAGAKEGQFFGEGVFPGTLMSIVDKGKGGPKSEGFPPFPGGEGRPDFYIREWCFAIEGAPPDACYVWATSSLNLSPTSKGYGYLVALCGGKAPPVDTKFNVETHLRGRAALLTCSRDAEGWCHVDQVTAMPAAMLSQRVGEATGAPVSAAPVASVLVAPAPTSPLRQQVEGTPLTAADPLPF